MHRSSIPNGAGYTLSYSREPRESKPMRARERVAEERPTATRRRHLDSVTRRAMRRITLTRSLFLSFSLSRSLPETHFANTLTRDVVNRINAFFSSDAFPFANAEYFRSVRYPRASGPDERVVSSRWHGRNQTGILSMDVGHRSSPPSRRGFDSNICARFDKVFFTSASSHSITVVSEIFPR